MRFSLDVLGVIVAYLEGTVEKINILCYMYESQQLNRARIMQVYTRARSVTLATPGQLHCPAGRSNKFMQQINKSNFS
jgi:hypothetical protein